MWKPSDPVPAAAVAVLLAAGRDGDALAVLGRIAGAEGASGVAAARALLELTREQRAAVLAREAVRLAASAPANLALVHESWIEAGLVGESDLVRAAVAGAGGAGAGAGGVGGADASTLAWLRRRVLGVLVDMPDSMPSGADLQARLEVLGRRRLALALQAVPPALQVQLAGRLGREHAEALLREVQAAAPRAEVSAAVRELQDLVAGSAPLLLVRAGARHLGAALAARGYLSRQLAQRLPRPVGLALLDEATRGAGSADAAPAHALDELLHQL